MTTFAAIPRSPFVPRTAQPLYTHMENSTRAELDQLGLTALRAMVDVEPYGSSDLGGDPSDGEPPSLSSAFPSGHENLSGKKKKKKRKSRRQERGRSREAKAIATSKLPFHSPIPQVYLQIP